MRSFYLLCEEPKELTIKGLPMSCHCYSGLITGHDMKLVIGGAGVYLTILLVAVTARLVGFGVGAFTHIFTHEVF